MGIFSLTATLKAAEKTVKYACPLCGGTVWAMINSFNMEIQAVCENCGAMYIGNREYEPTGKEVDENVYITERDGMEQHRGGDDLGLQSGSAGA